MFENNASLENLELRLAQRKLENAPVLEKIEKKFERDYKNFLEYIFGADFLGAKKYISAYFQLEKLDNQNKNDKEIFENAIKKVIENLIISNDKKELFSEKLAILSGKKDSINEKILFHSDINKDINFTFLEDLSELGVLSQKDILDISLAYKEKRDFLEASFVLSKDKRDIIKKHYFELNNTKSEERIENFKNDFSEEIENSKIITIYPKILRFIGKNYSKLKLRNRTETKKQRLRRMFKIAFLKFYRLKYSGLDINEILRKLETLDDLDDFLSLLIKFFEVLKQNPKLSSDYVVLEEIDEANELKTEAEENKEKTLFAEENILKASKLVEKTDKKLTKGDLDELLSDEVDLVGKNFIKRETEEEVEESFLNKEITLKVGQNNENAGILAEDTKEEDDEEENSEDKKEVDLKIIFEELKQKLFELEQKKKKLFLEGIYDEIDDLNDELIELIKELDKLKVLLGISEN